MTTIRVPQDRSLKAYRLARELGQTTDLSVEQIKERIMAEGIDEPTATEAAHSVKEDQRSRWESFDKQLGFSILFGFASMLIAAVQRELLFLGMIPIAGLFVLVQYPWGWRRPE